MCSKQDNASLLIFSRIPFVQNCLLHFLAFVVIWNLYKQNIVSTKQGSYRHLKFSLSKSFVHLKPRRFKSIILGITSKYLSYQDSLRTNGRNFKCLLCDIDEQQEPRPDWALVWVKDVHKWKQYFFFPVDLTSVICYSLYEWWQG